MTSFILKWSSTPINHVLIMFWVDKLTIHLIIVDQNKTWYNILYFILSHPCQSLSCQSNLVFMYQGNWYVLGQNANCDLICIRAKLPMLLSCQMGPDIYQSKIPLLLSCQLEPRCISAKGPLPLSCQLGIDNYQGKRTTPSIMPNGT